MSWAEIWPFCIWEFSGLTEIPIALKLLSYFNKGYTRMANSMTYLQNALIFLWFLNVECRSISSISSWAIRRLLCIVKVKFSQRNSEEVPVRARADKIVGDGRKNTSTHILLENYKLWNDWCWTDASLPASDGKI